MSIIISSRQPPAVDSGPVMMTSSSCCCQQPADERRECRSSYKLNSSLQCVLVLLYSCKANRTAAESCSPDVQRPSPSTGHARASSSHAHARNGRKRPVGTSRTKQTSYGARASASGDRSACYLAGGVIGIHRRQITSGFGPRPAPVGGAPKLARGAVGTATNCPLKDE